MPKIAAAVDSVTWDAFVADVAADGTAVDETVRRIAELPSYRGIPLDELAPSVRRNNAVGLQGLIHRRLPSAEHLAAYGKSGEQRARQGVTLADMLQGWSIGMELARASAYRHAPAGPEREALLLEAIEIITAWSTAGMHASADAHRAVELELARQEQHELANVVRRVLFGGDRANAPRGRLESYGVDPTGEYFAVRARPTNGCDARAVERWLDAASSDGRRNGLVALIDGDVAGFVTTLPANGNLPVAAGVAGPVSLGRVREAFRLASRALEAAVAVGREGVFDLASLGLTAAVLADDDVGATLLERYVAPLERQGRSGSVVLDTVDRYLQNDSQVERTAKALGVHPNTVRYRVSRFEQLTACSLKRNEALVEAWWALRRRSVT
jgi:hypothetical protein